MRPIAPLTMLLLAACSGNGSGGTRIIGHTVMGPEHAPLANGYAPIHGALDLGVHGVGLDVQMTADSVLVVFHDEDLGGTTSCTGLVNAMRWTELSLCTSTRLDSLLLESAARHPAAEFILDCKLFAHGDWWTYLESFTGALAALEAHPALKGRLLVECQVDPFLLLLQRKSPGLRLFRHDHDPEHAIRRAVTSHFTGIAVHHRRISAEQVRHAQGLGLEVTLFGTTGRVGHWYALRKRPDRLRTAAPQLLAPKKGGRPGQALHGERDTLAPVGPAQRPPLIGRTASPCSTTCV